MSWSAFVKTAEREAGSLVEQVATAALTRWAADPAPIEKQAREVVCASVVGARLVDAAIEKMAFTEEERAFLRALNAEAAERDLAHLAKTASPVAIGAGVGALAGAGYGAWRNEDDRLLGAALYAVPGAAIGAVGGKLYQELGQQGAAEAEALAAQELERRAGHAAARLDFKRQVEDAERWHRSLLDTTAMLSENAKDPGLKTFAGRLLNDLGHHRDQIVNHAFRRPTQALRDVPQEIYKQHYDSLAHLREIVRQAGHYHGIGY